MILRFGFLILFALLIFAFIAKSILNFMNPVKLTNESFNCQNSVCNYSYELLNTSDVSQTGRVIIHVRENDIPISYKLSKAYLGFKEEPFNLKVNQRIVVKGKYDSPKKAWLFFSLGDN